VLQRLREIGKGTWVRAGGVKRLPPGDDPRLKGLVSEQMGLQCDDVLGTQLQSNLSISMRLGYTVNCIPCILLRDIYRSSQ
jgi:hypothetical protein